MLAEGLPDLARVAFYQRAITRRDAQCLHRDAARVEHAEDIVVGRDDERRRLWEGRVLGEQIRLDVAVRADQREVSDVVVKRPRHTSDGRIRIKETILAQHEPLDRRAAPHRAKSLK